MRLRLLVAIGLYGALAGCGGDSSTPPPTGPTVATVSGVVSSSLGGGMNAATVTITPTGGSALAAVHTGADGHYSIASVPSGSGTVAVSGLSSGCTTPNDATYQGLAAGSTTTVNIVVTCQAPTGAINGTVTSSLGGALAGVVVTVTPESATALPSVRTDSTGKYTVAGTPLGRGTISFSAVPSMCTNPAPTTYTGLTTGTTKVVDVIVTCAPPPTGTVSGTITSSLGGGLSGVSVTVTPAGSAALTPVVTATNGSYAISHVPLANGSGSVSVSNVPTWCSAASSNYSGLAAGSTVTANVTVACQVTAMVISHCQTISAPGSYTLGADVSGQVANGYCVTINANDVALDCAGHTISADGTGATIVVEAVQRVTIHNCTVVATGSGVISAIDAYGPQQLTISDVHIRVTAPGAIGVAFMNSQDVAFTQSTILVNTQQYYAVYIFKTLRAQLTNDQITTNGGASYVQDSSSYITLANSTISDTSGPADVIAANGHNNKIIGNTIDGGWKGARTPFGVQGTDDGIGLSNEDNDTVSTNSIANAFDASIESVGNLTHTVIAGNIFSNTSAGVGSYWGTSWTGNEVRGNHLSGAIYLTLIVYDGNSISGYAPISSINFLDNSFDGNVFESPVITNFSNVASMVISLAGIGQSTTGLPLPTHLGQSSMSNNVLPASIAAFYLLPSADFLNGGGNVCNAANAGNAAFCGAGSTSTSESASSAVPFPPHRMSPFPDLPPQVRSEMLRMKNRVRASRRARS